MEMDKSHEPLEIFSDYLPQTTLSTSLSHNQSDNVIVLSLDSISGSYYFKVNGPSNLFPVENSNQNNFICGSASNDQSENGTSPRSTRNRCSQSSNSNNSNVQQITSSADLHTFSFFWKDMKCLTGWQMKLVPDIGANGRDEIMRIGHDRELYVVPGVVNFDILTHIENLEYFHTPQAMVLHLYNNPCLCQDWNDLWMQLQRAGWRERRVTSTSTSSVASSQSGIEYYYPLAENMLGISGVQRGIHTFPSVQLLQVYIARYPYLLQDDTTFAKTLQTHHWLVRQYSDMYEEEVDINNEERTDQNERCRVQYVVQWSPVHVMATANSSLHTYGDCSNSVNESNTSTISDSNSSSNISGNECSQHVEMSGWFTLKNIRSMLWVFPAELFRHYGSSGKHQRDGRGCDGGTNVVGSGLSKERILHAIRVSDVNMAAVSPRVRVNHKRKRNDDAI